MKNIKILYVLLLVLIFAKPGISDAGTLDFLTDSRAFASINSINYIEVINAAKQDTVNDINIVSANSIFPNKNPITPKTQRAQPKRTYIVPSTAYSSTPDQTDDTPFITAAGTHVRDGVVAANFLPLGTIIKIPELYGEKTFIVEDRMNKRYDYRVDVWFPTREDAKEFGLRKIKIEVL